jgi:hypothetical protein
MQAGTTETARESGPKTATHGDTSKRLPMTAMRAAELITGRLASNITRKVERRPRLRWLAVICASIFLVAFGVRLLRWQDLRGDFLHEENFQATLVGHYEREARQMIEEGRMLVPKRPADQGDARMLMHPPGYSILMVALFGDSLPGLPYFKLRLTQIICDAGAAVLVFLIAVELLAAGVALIAGLLVALSPHFAYYSLWLSPDSIAVLPILIAVYFIVRAIKRPRMAMIMASGLLIGLSCWLRTNALALAPLISIVVFFLFDRDHRLKCALVLAGSTMAVIAPITIRNWIVYHQFIPVSLNSGLNLIQGIAEYDKENRFGLPASDVEALQKEAEWYGRPDYGINLYVPDGIERDRSRLTRGIDVIKSHVTWFTGVMLKRMAFMFRYNDFNPQALSWNTSIAPAISQSPNFGHDSSAPDETTLVWRRSPSELIAEGKILSENTQVTSVADGQFARISSDSSKEADDFASPLFALRRNTDYVLYVPFTVERGSALVSIKGVDSRVMLASASLREMKKRRRRRLADGGSIDPEGEQAACFLQLTFASGSQREARLVLSKDPMEITGGVVQLGEAKLFEVGPTPYAWTHYPRALVRGIQKNLYRTQTMRLLICLGIVLLVVARRKVALAILLVVPFYYLCSHAAFSTEYRYILAMHYFLFIAGAATLYSTFAAMKQVVTLLIGRAATLLISVPARGMTR